MPYTDAIMLLIIFIFVAILISKMVTTYRSKD